MDYAITTDRAGENLCILVNSTIFNGTNAEINAALNMAKAGDLIYTVGYAAMKQKGLDGSWTSL